MPPCLARLPWLTIWEFPGGVKLGRGVRGALTEMAARQAGVQEAARTRRFPPIVSQLRKGEHVGGKGKGQAATPKRTLGAVRHYRPDYLCQGILGRGREVEPAQAVFIQAILRLHLGTDDVRLAAEVRPGDPRKEFHAAVEGQSLGKPELQGPRADILDCADQRLGGTGLTHQAT